MKWWASEAPIVLGGLDILALGGVRRAGVRLGEVGMSPGTICDGSELCPCPVCDPGPVTRFSFYDEKFGDVDGVGCETCGKRWGGEDSHPMTGCVNDGVVPR